MISRHWIRQAHRWLGMALTLTILANFVVRAFGTPPPAIVYAPLPPLALLLFSGLYLFFRPYRWLNQPSGSASEGAASR